MQFPSMPLQSTPLIGREHHVASVRDLLTRPEVRIVTLTGPGGVGKTRVALAVAAEVAPAFPDGVAFVGLAPLTDPALVVPALAQALGIREGGGEALISRLAAFLDNRRLLLILDNVEHVVAAVPVVADLVTRCPSLTVLATSRVRLRISGEREYLVPPLELGGGVVEASGEIAESASVRLFVERARSVRQDYTLEPAHVPIVVEICSRVDGLPLAIELAAARIKVLSPPSLLARLERRLPLLTGGARDLPVRQQTMYDAIFWSYDLLTDPERSLLDRLAVFVGGFSLEAAETVAGALGGEAVDVFDGITSLVDHSLLRPETSQGGGSRFVMLETIREFGLERLDENDDSAALRARHAAYFLAIAETADATPYTPAKEEWSHRLEADLPNLRAALEWATEQSDAEPLVRLASALWWFWERRGWLTDGRAWLERAVTASVSLPPSSHEQRARLFAHAGMAAVYRGDVNSAATRLAEALAHAHAAKDGWGVALVLLGFGQLAIQQGEWDRAVTHLRRALLRWRLMDETSWTVEALIRLGYAHVMRGAQDEAESCFAECLDAARATGWRRPIASALEALGTSARERGDLERASSLYAEALDLVRDVSEPNIVANCLKSLGAIAATSGHPEHAAFLFGASESMWERHGFGEPPAVERARRVHAEAPAREALSDAAFASSWLAGRDAPVEEAIAEGFAVAEAVSEASATFDGITGSDLGDVVGDVVPTDGLRP